MYKRSLLLVSLAALCGCATTANYKKAVNSWVGVDMDILVNSWGYPTRTFAAPNGNTVYEYLKSDSYNTPTYTSYNYDTASKTGNATTYGGETITVYCRTFFETNASKKIVKATFEGNGCRSK